MVHWPNDDDTTFLDIHTEVEKYLGHFGDWVYRCLTDIPLTLSLLLVRFSNLFLVLDLFGLQELQTIIKPVKLLAIHTLRVKY